MTDGPAVGIPSQQGDARPDPADLAFTGDHSLDPISTETLRLRARWRTASLASGWRFPSDWALPEVDSVCATVIRDGVNDKVLSGLGRARAASGAGLEETLGDLAALHAVLDAPESSDGFIAPDPYATPSRQVWVTALAWAEVALDQYTNTEVIDPLTGLPTSSYLRTRLAEVYRQADRDDRAVSDDHLLMVVGADLSGLAGWNRLTAMIVVADVLRSVFDGGESVAVLGSSAIGVLTARDEDLAHRAVAVRREMNERARIDGTLQNLGQLRIRAVRLKPTYAEACAQLSQLGRS